MFKNFQSHLVAVSSLAAAYLLAAPASAQNLISNGTFDEAKEPWWTHASAPAMQVAEVVDGRLCSTITGGISAEQAAADESLSKTQTWDVILGYSGIPLVNGQYYKISFSASSTTSRAFRFKIGLGEMPYTDYYIKTVEAVATPQVFTETFLNIRDNDSAQFQFHIGGVDGDICIDDVVVEQVAPPAVDPFVTQSLTGSPLKAHSQTLTLGTAVDTPIFLSNPLHNSIVAGEFSMITPANSMKMNNIHPSVDIWDFTETDALYAWAVDNGLDFRGHPLVWHTQAPNWLNDTEWSRDEMLKYMFDHIDMLMQHYPNIKYWDVVNEAIEPNHNYLGLNLRETVWSTRIGADFIDLAFQRAAQNNSSAVLMYNDYNSSPAGDPKADAVYNLVADMVARGIPIHAVGLQNHWFVRKDATIGANYNLQAFIDNMARYAAINIDVHLTEMDVRIQELPATPEQVAAQTQVYREVIQACIDAPNCKNLTVWGLSDIDSWVPSTFQGEGDAHLYDSNFVAKGGYQAMTEVLSAYPSDAEGGPKEGGGGCSYTQAPERSAGNWLLLLALLGGAAVYRAAPSFARRRM